MSEDEEKVKLRQMEQKMDKVYLTIQGAPEMGLTGIVDKLEKIGQSLELHRKESVENFKNFKRDIALDYVNDINDLDKRLKPIEIAHKERHKNLGVIGGVGLVIGFLVANIEKLINLFK